jgi:hypothetical protein
MPVRPKTYDRPGYRSRELQRRAADRLAQRDIDFALIEEGEAWSENERETYRRSHVIEPNEGASA